MKSGFVAILGRPNVGKSTLLNDFLNTKISIVTNKSQTTRNVVKGIYNDKDCQIVFVDTPGIHKPLAKLGKEMNQMAYESTSDVDAILLVVDVSKPFGIGDEFVISKLNIDESLSDKLIICYNKIDLAKLDEALKVKEEYKKYFPNAKTIDLCAQDKFNVDELLKIIKSMLPEGPIYYPQDIISDQDDVFFIKEIIREKALQELSQEVPHALAIYIDNVSWEENPMPITATIFVEKDSQKGIVIGANGKKIKEIGSKARKSLEAKFHKQVYLDLLVKVDEDWRNKDNSLKTYGYKTNKEK